MLILEKRISDLSPFSLLETALQDLQRAIELNPHYFESYRLIDAILEKDRQWETILTYWNALLKLEPAHADAYYERSGTYYHNGDREKAITDLKKACELGQKQACNRYTQMTQARL